MNRFFIHLFFVAFVFSCNNPGNQKEAQTKTEPEPQAVDQGQIYLPSISMDDIQVLWDNANQVDYLYYELPISSNLDDQYSIQQSLRHVSETPVPLSVKNKCKPIGRVFYKKDGEDLREADIYFTKGCTFFVFFENGKPAYSNLMTNEGLNHFNDIFEKLQKFQPKQ